MSQRLAGYTLGGADLLRRAMGKKKADEMAQQRAIFTEGSQKNDIDEGIATQVFDLMEKFANYGFNKSHAAAYALVSYQTAWLKRHHPAEFMAAVMSCDMDHTDTIVAMRDECLRMGLKLHSPDINRSRFRFTVPVPGEIVYGLGAIKGVGEGALEGILIERDRGGPFKDLFDFCKRIDLKRANKRVLEALICSGALDGFGLNRPSLMATLPKALQVAEKAAASESSGMFDMFGLGSETPAPTAQVEAEILPDWSQHELLDKERETLGFYLSGHPIEAWSDVIDAVCSGNLRELIEQHAQPAPVAADGKPAWQPRTRCLFGAWVTDLRFFKGDGKFGKSSYKLTLGDGSRQLSTWVDIDKWPKLQSFVKVDTLVFVTAEIGLSVAKEGREAEPRLYNPDFMSPDQLIGDYLARLTLRWRRPPADVTVLRKLLEPVRGSLGAGVTIEVANARFRTTLDFPPDWRIRPTAAVIENLRRMLGVDRVGLHYKKYEPPASERRFEKRAFAASAGFDDE
jgi:DNA polymerase-3 subunit alpha